MDVTFTEGVVPKVGAIFPNPEDVGWLEGQEWKVVCIVSDMKQLALLEAISSLDSIHSDHGNLEILGALADMVNDCTKLRTALR